MPGVVTLRYTEENGMKILMLALACSLTMAAHAGGWTQEPDSVLGLKLGVPLDQQSLPACQKPAYKSPVVCIETVETSPRPEAYRHWRLSGSPFGYVGFEILVGKDRVVTGLRAHMDHNRLPEFLMVLNERYGKPTSVTAGAVQNGAGGTFSNTETKWSGKRLSITASERYDTVDKSAVTFVDNVSEARRISEFERGLKDSASKL